MEQCCQEDLVPRKRKGLGLWEIYLAGRLSPFHLASWMKGPPQMLCSSVYFILHWGCSSHYSSFAFTLQKCLVLRVSCFVISETGFGLLKWPGCKRAKGQMSVTVWFISNTDCLLKKENFSVYCKPEFKCWKIFSCPYHIQTG